MHSCIPLLKFFGEVLVKVYIYAGIRRGAVAAAGGGAARGRVAGPATATALRVMRAAFTPPLLVAALLHLCTLRVPILRLVSTRRYLP